MDRVIRDRAATVGPWLALSILLCCAIGVRAAAFGNPVTQLDEQFYLLVADRLLQGAIPYVDIWDRKPVGLFLLYAPFAAFGRSAVIACQVAALAAVTGTAFLIFTMARRIAGHLSALLVALLYIVWLNLAGGESGQSPVFYNLLMTGAVAILSATAAAAAGRPAKDAGDNRWHGFAAMVLIGTALQIKYSAAFEGLFVGLAFLWISRRAGRPVGRLGVDAALWVGVAALPTAIAAGTYAAIGHLAEWYFANVASIFLRGPEAPGTSLNRALILCAITTPLVVPLVLRRWLGDRTGGVRLRIADLWALSALGGVAVFGTWYAHYALPLFAPLAVAAAPLGGTRAGRACLLSLIAVGTVAGQVVLVRRADGYGSDRILAAAAAATAGRRNCLFVYDGYTALYRVTQSCLPTTHPFPAHLHSRNETGATGIDQLREVRRIMAARPDRVVTVEPAYREENPAVRGAVYAVLKRDYVERYRNPSPRRQLVVYALRGTIP